MDSEGIHNLKESCNPMKIIHANCIVCSQKLTGKQQKFCSLSCKNSDINNRHKNYESQKNRGLQRRLELIKLLGGKCQICGYCQNNACLSFHHRTPSTKLFCVDIRQCSNRSWQCLLEEINKCDLLCLNCHCDLHHPHFRLG